MHLELFFRKTRESPGKDCANRPGSWTYIPCRIHGQITGNMGVTDTLDLGILPLAQPQLIHLKRNRCLTVWYCGPFWGTRFGLAGQACPPGIQTFVLSANRPIFRPFSRESTSAFPYWPYKTLTSTPKPPLRPFKPPGFAPLSPSYRIMPYTAVLPRFRQEYALFYTVTLFRVSQIPVFLSGDHPFSYFLEHGPCVLPGFSRQRLDNFIKKV